MEPPDEAATAPPPDGSVIDIRVEYEFQHAALVVGGIGEDMVVQAIEGPDGLN